MAAHSFVRSTSHRARRGASLFARLFDAVALHRQRRRLAELPDHLLEDVGLTRHEAEIEARRLPWDAPRHWLR